MKGVTSFACVPISCFWISIHTPTKGVTSATITSPLHNFDFNPHSHEGSDPGTIEFSGLGLISIHTPTKGVTKTTCYYLVTLKFQSTLPRREWPGSTPISFERRWNFNPHSHEGSDRSNLTEVDPGVNFNPHSHEGSDAKKPFLTASQTISIHTPTKGVTLGSGGRKNIPCNFNPHSHEGSD